jgi:integrase
LSGPLSKIIFGANFHSCLFGCAPNDLPNPLLGDIPLPANLDQRLALNVVGLEHQPLAFGDIPDGVAVDLSLIKLPEGALMFPSLRRELDFTRLKDAKAVSKYFEKRARKIFPGLCFHDLRGSHETALLDSGVPVHVVAARCGHDPAVLLRSYAKRTRKADTSAANVIGAMSAAALE